MKTVTKTIDINAHIANIICEISVDNDASKALISFDNLGFGVVTAVKFNAKGFNSFGDVVQVGGKDKFYLIIQDISIEKNTSVKNLKAKLPNSDIRRLELEECQICYADGSVSSYAGLDSREFEIEQFDTVGAEKETLDAIRDIISPKAKSVPKEVDSGWICSCERYNTYNFSACSNCGADKSEIFKITDPDLIAEIITKHKKLEENRQEKAQQEAKEKEKSAKSRKVKIGIGIIIGIVLAILIGHAIVISGRTTYSSETEMKSALQGTYTLYSAYGTASKQILIDGNTAIYRWSNIDHDIESTITKWDYKNGKIHTFEDLIVTNQGDLTDGSSIYEKGGYMLISGSSNSSNYNYESGYSVLKITVDSVTSNSSYTVCTGSIKNNGTKTYKYIKIKGAFKDSSGDVIDTDWTYAAGAEGLAPDESTTFRLSVTKNSEITSCSVSLLDYD